MASTLHTSGTVYVWNSYSDQVDADGNPVPPAAPTPNNTILADGDVVLASISDPFWIDWTDDSATLPPVDYAITYAMDTSVDPPIPDNPVNDDSTIEVDPDAFENFDQYYDDDENPVYEVSDCNSGLGIRG